MNVKNFSTFPNEKIKNDREKAVECFGGSAVYSTDEQVVGKWIDNRPVYQKTFTGIRVSLNFTNWQAVVTDVHGMAAVIQGFGSDANNQVFYPTGLSYEKANSVIKWYQARAVGNEITSLTVQYIKPID